MYPTIEQTDDQDLSRRALRFLTDRGLKSPERLHLNAHGGVLTIGGYLPSDHDRRLCVECCQRIAGVVRIVDHIRVARVHARRLHVALAHAPARRAWAHLSN